METWKPKLAQRGTLSKLSQILKNDTDLRDADQRITGTVLQFYKIDNTIRVADLRKYFTNKTREYTLYWEGMI